MQRSFFDIVPFELDQLGPEPAVTVLREMLWAEVHNLGLPISDADIPFAVTTADGGIDAVVKGTPSGQGNGLIFAPITSYQVKAGDFTLNATSSAQIESLLMTPAAVRARINTKAPVTGKSHQLEDISPRVQNCLDAGGTFVTVLFGNNAIDKEEGVTENAIRTFLQDIDPKYKHAKIKVWRQSTMCGLLRAFPAVSLMIKGLHDFPLLNHKQWSASPEMQRSFVVAPAQEKAIDDLRRALRDDSQGAIHIRVLGEPGIGKTRLIFETTRADDLRPLVLYADRGSKIDGSVLAAIRSAQGARIILVVDECGPDLRSELMRTFGGFGPALKLVTIYQDGEESDRASDYRLMDVPALPAGEIEAILHSYGVDAAYARGWAEMCEGSPRVAHVVGQNLRDNPDDPLRSDAFTRIWVRYLAADVPDTSEEYRKRHLVVATMALFKRFGWAPVVRAGTNEVYERIISQLDAGISKAQFAAIIEQMTNRKILQGDYFLYITPKALQIKLWTDWWKRYSASVDMNSLVPALSPQMRQWFGEMIEYADVAPVSKQVVARLLGPDGLYADADWLKTKDGARFFFSLSLADPLGALRLLERTLGKMSKEDLLGFDEGRRDAVRALEHMTLHGDLFRPAAKLLLALAEAENETWSNNATGTFSGLFSLGYGDLAPTSLAPEHRLPVLTEALARGGKRAEVALGAFNTALKLRSITRWGGDQPFRLKGPVQRWLPKTYGEWFDAYRLYWKTLEDALPTLSASMRRQGMGILLSRMRGLVGVELLRDEVLETLARLAAARECDKQKVIESIGVILRYDRDGLPASVVEKLEAVRDYLVGITFSARLRRYAGMDILEDQLDNDENELSKAAQQLSDLAEHALRAPDEFQPELSWLVTDEGRSGYRFGHMLGQKDQECRLWGDILKAWRAAGARAHDFFIGGYLRAVFEHRSESWEEIIRRDFAEDPGAAKILPALIWRSGMTEYTGQLVLALAQRAQIEPEILGIFATGRTAASLSDEVFGAWLDFLIGVGAFTAAATALNLASMSLLAGRKLATEQMKRLITQRALLERESDRADVMLTHNWFQLAKALVTQDMKEEITVLTTLIENIGNSGAITGSLGPEDERYVDELVARHPAEAWHILSSMIKLPMDARGFAITHWLRGDHGFHGRSPGPMRHIPREELWKWIEAEPGKRAPYVATMAPKDFDPQSWRQGLIRELLCRFGDSDAVRSAVFANFFTGGWSGPASAHYEAERNALIELRDAETDPNALRWLNEAIASTEANIESAKIDEEARGY